MVYYNTMTIFCGSHKRFLVFKSHIIRVHFPEVGNPTHSRPLNYIYRVFLLDSDFTMKCTVFFFLSIF